MEIQFELTVKVIGKSLEDVDNGLVQAAGERLRARMLNPPPGPLGQVNVKVSTTPVATVARPLTPTVEPVTIEPKRRGRPPKAKVNTNHEGPNYEASAHESEGNSSDEESTHALAAGTPQDSQSASQKLAEAPQEVVVDAQKDPFPSLNDCVQALSRINSQFNIDKARACLAHFHVKRCQDLPEDKRQNFISYCNGL